MIIWWREWREREVMEWKRQNVCFPSQIYTDWAVWGEESRGHLLENRVSIYSSYAENVKATTAQVQPLVFQIQRERERSKLEPYIFLPFLLSFSSSFLPHGHWYYTVMLLCCLVYCWNTWSRMRCSNNIISLTWATVLPPTMPLLVWFFYTLYPYQYIALLSFTQLHFLYHFCLILCMWMCASFSLLTFLYCTENCHFFSILSPYLHYILLLSLFECPYIFLGSLLIVKSGNYCWCDVVVAAAALQKL